MKLYGLDYNNKPIEVEILEGKISKVKHTPKVEKEHYIIPGFIEMHAHGGYGFDFMDADLEAAKKYLNKIALLEGTTSVLGTTITADYAKTLLAIKTHKKLIGHHLNGANLVGIHLEGPFINPLKKGGHPVKYMKKVDYDSLQYFVKGNEGVIKKITYAPELTDLKATEDIVSMGILPSAGHTMINVETLKDHMLCGLKCITHFNNAMPKLQDNAELAKYALKENSLSIEYIADGIHNPVAIGKTVLHEKDKHKITLITDSLHVKGLQDGDYPGPNWTITKKNGAAWTPEGVLNGSVYTLIEAFRDWINIYGATIEQAVLATSTNAAELLHLNKGKIEEGYDADIIVLDKDFNIVKVLVNGKELTKE